MLESLSIRNYIIIESLEIDFNKGFSVITGETGSGKSIIIGAISLLLGKRAESDVLFSKDKKCVIEATFNIKQLGIESVFAQYEVDYADNTIVRREILPEGKSRAFINDTPVNLATLKALTDNFIDLHSQHESLALGNQNYRLQIVDASANTILEFEKYQQKYAEFVSIKQALAKKKNLLAKSQTELDFYNFQATEIENARLSGDNEIEELEGQAAILENAEDIQNGLYEAKNLYCEGDNCAKTQLKQIKTNLVKIGKNYKLAEELAQRLESALIELDDINFTIEKQIGTIELNPQLLQQVNERLDLLIGLMTKHRCANIAELKLKCSEYRNYVNNTELLEEEIAELEKNFAKRQEEVYALAKMLSTKRTASFAATEQYINGMLVELGMPHAIFEISNIESEISESGIDNISFMFTANKSVELQAIEKVASGGELSRLMLALKSLIAKSLHTPTILFDEIDTGVSGEIAAKMGKIMCKISESVQVLSITHLPQVAALGNEHFKVYKQTDDYKTISSIKKLSHEERITEIAAMMSGEKLTQQALDNAKVLLGC